MKILFWNLNRCDRRGLVCAAVNAESADVVVLIENKVPALDTLSAIQDHVSFDFSLPDAIPGRFQVFSRATDYDLSEIYSGDRVSIRRFKFSGVELLLGVVHVVDKRNFDDSRQSVQAVLLADEIRRVEQQCKHERTIVIGDFNMNPFDEAMNIAAGMNAMMTAKCVKRRHRTVQKLKYPFFYNPMWGLFGDRTIGPAGTFYNASGSRGTFGWNMLDQVLLRPDAIELFANVEILSTAGATSLETAQTRPASKRASDHLPVVVTLK